MKITWKLIIILMLAGAVLAGCAQADAASSPRVGSISEDKFAKTASGEEMFFTIPVDQKFLDSGQKISIRANGNIGQGRLHLVLRDPAGQTTWDPGAFGGEFQVNTYAQPKTVGDYQLGIFWDGAVSGSYQLSYQALALTAAALIPGLGMILVAVGFTVYSRRKGGSWRYLLLGGLVWFAAVAIKFAWAIPINSIVYKALNVSLSQLASPGNLAAYIYVGLLTGVTEVLFMWLLSALYPQRPHILGQCAGVWRGGGCIGSISAWAEQPGHDGRRPGAAARDACCSPGERCTDQQPALRPGADLRAHLHHLRAYPGLRAVILRRAKGPGALDVAFFCFYDPAGQRGGLRPILGRQYPGPHLDHRSRDYCLWPGRLVGNAPNRKTVRF